MSRKVATLVYSKQVGSMARKSVLAYFADRANDDGTGIWTAKQRVADEIECSKQTVITTVKALVAAGLLIESGHRPNGNGYTVEYAIDLALVAALPDSKRLEQGVQISTGPELDGSNSFAPRSQTALPKPSLNRPIPKKDKPSLGRVRTSLPALARGSRLDPDWQPSALPADLAIEVEAWRPGRLERVLAQFRTYWPACPGAKGRKADWQATWQNWLWREIERDGQHRNGSITSSYPDRGGGAAQLLAERRGMAVMGGEGHRLR